jgi:hypothetical protein
VSLLVVGCASSNNTSAAGSSASTTAAVASAVGGAAGLYNSLGGSAGVTQLANAFGVKLSANNAVTKFLDQAAIATAQTGLFNSIAAAAGQSLPAGSVDLMGALSGKGLDAAAITGVGQALTGAATERGLKPDQMASLASLWDPIGKSLVAGK